MWPPATEFENEELIAELKAVCEDCGDPVDARIGVAAAHALAVVRYKTTAPESRLAATEALCDIADKRRDVGTDWQLVTAAMADWGAGSAINCW